jgi:uncharacterized membrane protein
MRSLNRNEHPRYTHHKVNPIVTHFPAVTFLGNLVLDLRSQIQHPFGSGDQGRAHRAQHPALVAEPNSWSGLKRVALFQDGTPITYGVNVMLSMTRGGAVY